MRTTLPVQVLALLASLLLAKGMVVLWGVNRGFDLGDGGFFLLNLNQPAESPPLFEFYKLLLLFDPPLRFGPIGARTLRIAAEALGTVALVHGVFRWTKGRLPHAAAAGFSWLLLVTGLGSLLSVAAREFGYNDATNLLVFTACACLFRLLAVTAGPAAQTRRWLLAATAGFLLGLQLFVKYPATLLLLALAVPMLLGLLRASVLQRAGALLALALGMAAAVGVFVAANGGIAPLVAKWEFASEVNQVTGYGVAEILRVYLWNDYASHVALARFALAGLAFFGLLYRALRGRPDRVDLGLALALLAGIAVLLHGAFTYHADNVHPWLIALWSVTLLLCLVSLLLAWRDLAPSATFLGRWQILLPLWLLAALPFVEMAGTNVALTLRLPTHVAPLFLLLGVLLPELRAAGHRVFAWTSLGVLAVISSLVFHAQHVERPYGLPSPLYRQVHAVNGLPGLRVDAPTRAFLEALQTTLAQGGFRPGDPVLALDFMPGLVYYLGGRSPGFPFFPFDRPQQNCWAINRAADPELPFLILGQSMTLEQHDCIERFSFPLQFEELGTLANPYTYAIPYFFGGPPMPFVKLYGPKGAAAEAPR